MRPVPRSVLLGLSILAGFVLVTWALSREDVSLGWAATQIFWFLVVFLVVIPIHELGHAVAGLLVGHRIQAQPGPKHSPDQWNFSRDLGCREHTAVEGP